MVLSAITVVVAGGATPPKTAPPQSELKTAQSDDDYDLAFVLSPISDCAFVDPDVPYTVSVGGDLDSGTVGGSGLNFDLPNGTYGWSASVDDGYTLSPSSGSVTVVLGAIPITQVLVFYTPPYMMIWTESGLPTGTPWSVSMYGCTDSGVAPSGFSYEVTDASYFYAVNSSVDPNTGTVYLPDPSSGTVVVDGSNLTINVIFTAAYNVTFEQTLGSVLPTNILWKVTLNGVTKSDTLTDDSITFENMTDGTYDWSVSSVPGYVAQPSSGSVAVNGDDVEVFVTFVESYNVTFYQPEESQLPSGHSWGVTFDGTDQTGTDEITFSAINGTYDWSVDPIQGYTSDPSSGTTVVDGDDIEIAVNFTAVLYPVTFTETGLPKGTDWSVTLNGTIEESTAASIAFTEPNGTYSFTVGRVAGWVLYDYSGTVNVSGTAATVVVSWVRLTYSVTFTETGLPSATVWYLNVSGEPSVTSKTDTATIDLGNGTYSYSINSSNPRFAAFPWNGSFTVAGTSLSKSVNFSAIYAVTFTEMGLPAGTHWSVTLNGSTHASTSPTLSFMERNDSYQFSVGPVAGYGANPSVGYVTVSGAPVSVVLTFSAVYTLLFSETTLPSGTNWSVSLTGAASAVILIGSLSSGSVTSTRWSNGASSIDFQVSNGSYSYTIAAPGHSNVTGSVTVNGPTEQPVTVRFPSSSSSPFGLSRLDYEILGVVVLVLVIGVAIGLMRRRG
jgi:hypothetical protein